MKTRNRPRHLSDREHETRSGRTLTYRIPIIRQLCHRCDGTGTTVNPAIDGNGISPEEFAEDPDFTESYFSGVFDIPCPECSGEKVIEVPCRERMKKTHLYLLDQEESEEREHRELSQMEARFGC